MLGWLGHSCCTYWERTSFPMEGRQCPQGGWPFSAILRMLRGPTRVKLALPTFTLPWTHSTVGLCINWWGLESSLRLVFFSFYFVVPYKHYFLLLQLFSTTRHLGLTKLYLVFLQTAFMSLSHKMHLHSHSYLTNRTYFSCKLSSYKL